jgi:hypothetical protein
MTGFLLLILAFVAGVFFGIWMDWSAVKNVLAGGRQLQYDVEPYLQANLDVNHGDTLSLVGPDGNPVAGLRMNFNGYSPCKAGTSPDKCEIDTTADAGPYYFTCTGSSVYSCPDPAIQQSSTNGGTGLEGYGFYKALSVDVAHLLGEAPSIEKKQIVVANNAASATASTLVAYVSCDLLTKTTKLTNQNGSVDYTDLKPDTNQPVFWISPKPFNLTLSSWPAGFCPTPPNGGGNGIKQAQCNDLLAGQSLNYTVQALPSSTTACSVKPATLATPASSPKK